MKRNTPAVHWAEGMFLSPHHMQAMTRHIDDRFAQVQLESVPFAWGVQRLQIDGEALSNFVFRLDHLVALFENGTSVRIPAEGEVPSRDLKEFFVSGTEVLDIFIAVPELRMRAANVVEESAAPDPGRRFRVKNFDLADENHGENEQSISFRQLQCKILISGEDRAGFECLPIARISLNGQVDAFPVLVDSYVPPIKRMGASEKLTMQVRDIGSALATKARSLGEQVSQRRLQWSGDGGGGDAELLWKLQTVNQAQAVIGPLALTSDLPPFQVYLELCRLAGQLAVFDASRVAPSLGEYTHDDPLACFDRVIQVVRSLLDVANPTSFESREFTPHEEGYVCSLDGSWTSGSKQLYLCVESDKDIEDLIPPLQRYKLSGTSLIAEVQRNRLSGVEKTAVLRTPAQLPDRPHLHYWELNQVGEFWKSAVEDGTLAIFGRGLKESGLKFHFYVTG